MSCYLYHRSILVKTIILAFLLFLSSMSVLAQQPFNINIAAESKGILNSNCDHALVFSAETMLTDTLFLKDGAYYSQTNLSPNLNSFICIPQNGEGKNYTIKNHIKNDGSLYYVSLPEEYKIAQTELASPLLGFSDSYKNAFVSIPVGFLRIVLNDNGKKYETLTLDSSSNPLSGWMLYDGTSLHPSAESAQSVSVGLLKKPKVVFIPVIPDYPFDLTAQLSVGVNKITKKFNNIMVGRKEIRTIYFRPSSGGNPKPPKEDLEIEVPDNATPDSPGDTEIKVEPEKEVVDSILPLEQYDIVPCNCDYTPHMTVKEVAELLWTQLDGENKWVEGRKKNWMSDLSVELWAGITRTRHNLYEVEIQNGVNMDKAVVLVGKLLESDDVSTSENSPAFDPTAAPIRNRPQGPKAYRALSIEINGCEELGKLTLINTQITELTIRNCKNLENLVVMGNSIEKLIIECCPNLNVIACAVNRLEVLEIEECPEVTTLFCPGNFIMKLDVTHLHKLQRLNCALNLIVDLDLTHNRYLQELICYYNMIKTLDLSKIGSLKTLICSGNDFIKVTPSLSILKSRGLKRYNIKGKVKIAGQADF